LENKLQLAEEEVKRVLTQEYDDDDINNLELRISDYFPKCNFFVLQTKEVDVVLGNTWLKYIGTFTMNVDKSMMQEHLSMPAMHQPASPHQCTHSMRRRGTNPLTF
jgi:hypothetical protein